MAPPVDDRPGQQTLPMPADTVVAGRFRVISRLGEGGMGVTYRAWDFESKRPVVLKQPKPAMLAQPGFPERFSREARMMAALSHPHIVPVTTVGEHEGTPYYAMPFLPGGSLSHRRLRDPSGRPSPMHPSTLHLWLPKVAAAIDYVHANGIVHRDVKPANVFFDAFWHAYLGDFGIAKVVASSDVVDREQTLTATSMAIGTQEYMAPELFVPQVMPDGRADQYALAVIAYDMLAGTKPFTGDSAHIIVEIATRRVPPLRRVRQDLPASLERAVYRALAKNRDERFASCSEFAAAALADVLAIEDAPGKARLLCPACESIIKVDVAKVGLEGLQGRCKRCGNRMRVAPDMSALWLSHEETGAATNANGSARSVINFEGLWESPGPDADLDTLPTHGMPGGTRHWISWAVAGLVVVSALFTEAVFINRYVSAKLGQQIESLSDELESAEARIRELEGSVEHTRAQPRAINE